MNLRLATRFYLGLGAPARGRRYPDCSVRAAAGYDPELVRTLLLIYRGESAGGEARKINHRCAEIRLASGRPAQDPEGSFEVPEGRFFFKEFPWRDAWHGVERFLRLSRVDRAWRAAHLLPRVGINTPPAVGTVIARGPGGRVVEYLATEWLDGARPFPEAVRGAKNAEERLSLLCEFARSLRFWHDQGVYLRDLVKNVLVTEADGKRTYWLSDLDGLHPAKRVTRARVLWHMRQLAHHVGPVGRACPPAAWREEAKAVCAAYAKRPDPAIIAALSRLS
jgi:hypothetical protein